MEIVNFVIMITLYRISKKYMDLTELSIISHGYILKIHCILNVQEIDAFATRHGPPRGSK